MSFEEKYNRYKKSGKLHVSDDYVNEMAGKVSEHISSRKKGIPRQFVWIFSGTAAIAVCMAVVFFAPLNHTDNPGNAVSQQTGQPNLNMKDSGNLASNSETQKIESKELDHDAIVEYLLDEEYEEI